MDGIILHRGIANRDKLFDPNDYLRNDVPQDNNVTVGPIPLPSLLQTNVFVSLGIFQKIGRNVVGV